MPSLEWYTTLLLLFSLLVAALLTGIPVAFAFMLLNIVGLIMVFGGTQALGLLVPSAAESVANFNLTPLPMFILMGELLTRTGMAALAMDSVDKLIGRVPGRLSVVAIAGGTLWAALSGMAMASTAMLGSTLGPQMEKRGYKPQMSVAAILGSASLDPLIPPSSLAILLGVLANVSISKLLVAGAAPGLVLAIAFMVYFVVRARLQPWLAPDYDAPDVSLGERLGALRHLIPLAALIFIVVGLIFLGIATPTETAALGAVGAAVLAGLYGRLNKETLTQVAVATIETTAMIFMILVGSKAYSQMIAATGAASGWVDWVAHLQVDPIMTVLGMIVIVLILGCFIDALSIMLITVPLFMPIVTLLGFDPLWFALLILISVELGGLTPPFGVQLFVMKAVQPHLPMGDIYRSVMPILIMQLLCILVFMAFPSLTYVLLQFMK